MCVFTVCFTGVEIVFINVCVVCFTGVEIAFINMCLLSVLLAWR